MTHVLPTDWQLRQRFESADYPPGIADPMDDEFTGPALDPKWSWMSQGSTLAYLPYEAGGLLLSLRDTTTQSRGIYQSVPTAPWEFTAYIQGSMGDPGSNYTNSSLFIAENTTGQIRHVALFRSQSVFGIQQTTTSATPATWGSLSAVVPALYARMAWNGTTLTGSYSVDGYNYYVLNTENLAWTPTLVGLSVLNNRNVFSLFNFGWFRRTA